MIVGLCKNIAKKKSTLKNGEASEFYAIKLFLRNIFCETVALKKYYRKTCDKRNDVSHLHLHCELF